MDATVEEPLEAVVSMLSMLKLYSKDKWEKFSQEPEVEFGDWTPLPGNDEWRHRKLIICSSDL
jgi:hypothetical protein